MLGENVLITNNIKQWVEPQNTFQAVSDMTVSSHPTDSITAAVVSNQGPQRTEKVCVSHCVGGLDEAGRGTLSFY